MQPRPIDNISHILALTAEDVNRLLHDNTPQMRIEMTDRIAGAYNQSPLTEYEVLIAEQIFRLLLRDTEVRVRVSLSEHLKDSKRIPHDVVISLAQDVEEVALPMLQYSEVLTDEDLLDLISATEQISRYLAISRRRSVSDLVTDQLIQKGNEEVAHTLVANEGARISDIGYSRIVESFQNNVSLMKSLSERPYLPVTVVDKLVNVVSHTLGESIKKKYHHMPDEQIDREIDKEVEKTREKETLRLIRNSDSEVDTERLILQLQASGRLNPSVILSALCQGNFNFFEMSLAKLSDIPAANARKLINDRGELGFRAIYNKSGLPDAMFPAVKLLLKIVHELHEEGEQLGTSRYANRLVERILQYSEDKNMENLSYIIALVRRIAQ